MVAELPCPCLPRSQSMDTARFWDLVIDAIHAADAQSPLNGSGGGSSGGSGGGGNEAR